jgi:hypothetical protein
MTPSSRRKIRTWPGDRRINRRYPIIVDLEYRVVQNNEVVQSGIGRSIDLSTGGVLFESQTALMVGTEIEVSIAWPVRLHDAVALNLCISGKVARTDGQHHAVSIEDHEFCVRGRYRLAGPRFRATSSAPSPAAMGVSA